MNNKRKIKNIYIAKKKKSVICQDPTQKEGLLS
jgi:hypothetical protein